MTEVIAREVRDVDPAVVAAGPPVIPNLAGRFRLRLVDPDGDDPTMLADWFARPHLVQTWDQPWSAETWAADTRTRLAGDYSRPLVVSHDGRDVAYLELYRVARDEIARLYRTDPYDTGLHIATADTSLLGRGVMSGFMGDLVEAVFADEPRCRRVVAEPAAENTRMRRALVKQGFVELGDFQIRPDRRITLCVRGRSPLDVPEPHPVSEIANPG
ncbi:MAG: GNAT family N-acetyltransferase [Gordonia sp. (in: high G+C Gram-positive bacteria)]|uniref:GNAT family N-acetyltransferase n=1 Tax=Gordonia sp. (in: high G+C Gram-positive bacteria) TaxID=84139 RepID=UPI0039E3783E